MLVASTDLITEILNHQDLDSLLRLSVVVANKQLDGDGCSLFFFDRNTCELVLKESTVVSPHFYGRQALQKAQHLETIKVLLKTHRAALKAAGADPSKTLTWDAVSAVCPELLRHIVHYGLTRWSVELGEPLVVDELENDVRHSGFPLKNVPKAQIDAILGSEYEPRKRGVVSHCELPHGAVGSALFAPVAVTPSSDVRSQSSTRARRRRRGPLRGTTDASAGLIRLVRRKNRGPFSDQDQEQLATLAHLIAQRMQVAVSLTDILDLGAMQEIEVFGEQLVDLVSSAVDGKGCSIYLEEAGATGGKRTFKCIATTGLGQRQKEGPPIPIEASEATYTVDESDPVCSSFTEWVVKKRKMVIVENLYELDLREFPDLERAPGAGRFSELFGEEPRQKAGPFIAAPLFVHDDGRVAGVIRAVGRAGDKFFPYEKLFVFDIAQRLSRVLGHVRFRVASEKLFELNQQSDEILNRLPYEVCSLLGVGGCSVFLRIGNQLTIRATAGLLEDRQDEVRPYELREPPDGWTAWVGVRRKALMVNSPSDVAPPPDGPVHRSDHSLCEVTNGPHRFLGVPILGSGTSDLLGVIRAPRGPDEPPFEASDLALLKSFAARLSLALQHTRRSDRLRAVAQLADASGPGHSPAHEQVAERAVSVLVDKVELEFAAIHWLAPDTRKISLLRGRSIRAETNPDRWAGAEHDEAGPDIHARVLRSRKPATVQGGTMLEEPDLPTDAFFDMVVYRECDHDRLLRYFCPIVLGDAGFGTIEVGYDVAYAPREITDEQKDLVRLVASACARTFYAEYATKKLENIRHGLTAISNTMRGQRRFDERLHSIAESAAQATRASAVTIHERIGGDLDQPTFGLRVFGGAAVVPREAAALNYVANLREPLFVTSGHQGKHPSLLLDGFASVAAFPLLVGEKMVGCAFFDFERVQRFGDEQQQEILIMGEYMASVLLQHRLMAEKMQLYRFANHSLKDPLSNLLAYFDRLSRGKMLSSMSDAVGGEFDKSTFAQTARDEFYLVDYMRYLTETFLKVDILQASDEFNPRLKCQKGVDIGALCDSVQRTVNAIADVRIDVSTVGKPTATCDPRATRLALLNIVFNAHKYGDGHVVIHVRPRDGGAHIDVDDNGPGIPGEFRDEVLQLGFRIPGNQEEGLGIGLYLTAKTIENQNGTITVGDSHLPFQGKPGACGARVTIWLPGEGN